MSDQLLAMGRVGRPHGIKGEIGVDWAGEFIPKAGQVVFLQAGDSDPEPWKIAASRNHNGKLLLTLEGVADRTKADSLKGRTVLLPRESLPEPAEDEAFVQDLPGFAIHLPDGQALGILDRVEFPAGQMVWAILDQDGKEILFPAYPDFIKSIDKSQRKAVIDPPPGLLEIYRA